MQTGPNSVDESADPHRDVLVASEVRNGVKLGLIGFALVLGVVVYMHRILAGIVAPILLTTWFTAIVSVIAVFYVATCTFILRRPSDEEILRFWSPLSLTVVTLIVVIIAAGNAVFLWAATPELRLMIVVLAMSFVVVQTVGHTQVGPLFLSVGANLGPMIVYFLKEGGPESAAIAVFLVAFGVTVLTMRRYVRGSVIAATKARADSERTARALEIAKDVVAAERDARTRFIRSASHDLQQPIHAAALFLDRALQAETAMERAEAGTRARTALASTQSLLAHMLDHLRLEAGAMPVTLCRVPLGPVIAAAVADMVPLAHAAGIRIITPETGLAVIADAEHLSRVLKNLIGNAIRHSMGERVLVGARRRNGAFVDIWVVDDGAGVSAEDRARLFEDFTQGSDHALVNRGGFGLGLSSVRRLAELMNGAAVLDERWSNGAAFVVRLPAAERDRNTSLPDPLEASCEAA